MNLTPEQDQILEAFTASIREVFARFLGTPVNQKTIGELRATIAHELHIHEVYGLPRRWVAFDILAPTEKNPNALRIAVARNFAEYPLNEEEFTEFFGEKPIEDQLHRLNCKEAGETGHYVCGWCFEHSTPRFDCGCVAPARPRFNG